MCKYNIEYINDIINKNNYQLEPIVQNYLNNILNDINMYDDSLKNKFDKRLKKKDFNIKKPYDTLQCNVNRIKDINNKSEYELIITNIKKILNKLSFINYEKLKNELIYDYIQLYNNKNKHIEDINKFIFDNLIYTNIVFNNLYFDIFIELNKLNNVFIYLMNKNIDNFISIYKHIHVCDNKKYDELCKVNKHNDKYKCLLDFYIKCFENNLINYNIINETIKNLQNELILNIEKINMKSYCEELTNFLFILISKTFIEIKKNIEYNNIYDNVHNISIMKNGEKPSISNKIIFQHKDIVEKYMYK